MSMMGRSRSGCCYCCLARSLTTPRSLADDAPMHRRTGVQDELQELDDSVTRLKKDFGKRTSEAEALKLQLQKTEKTLDRAETLLGKLSGEKDRWVHEVKNLRRQMSTLPRQAMMAAGFVTCVASAAACLLCLCNAAAGGLLWLGGVRWWRSSVGLRCLC